VSLELKPGPGAEVRGGVERVTGEVSVEVSRNTSKEQIWVVTRHAGVVQVAESDTIGCVRALQSAGVLGLMVVARVATVQDRALLQEIKLTARLADGAHFVSVLHVATNTGSILDDGDAERLKLCCWVNTAQL
jgi:hypothetical protein